MKLLFLTYHFLGPLLPLAVWLAERGHEILYATNRSSDLQTQPIAGIKRVILKRFSAPLKKDSRLDILENALRAARYAETSFQAIKESGFSPDLVFSASSGGAALAIPSVFPSTFWLNFLEAPRGACPSPPELLAQKLQISLANASLVFYPGQKFCFPEHLRVRLRVFRPLTTSFWHNSDTVKREPRLGVFFNLLNPQTILNGFLEASPQNRAVWIVENAYAKRAFNTCESLAQRCAILDRAEIEKRRGIFQQAQLAFFEYPGEMAFQAMACGCPTFASSTVKPMDLPKGLLFTDANGSRLSSLLEDNVFLLKYGGKCHSIISRHFAAKSRMPGWFEKICQEACQNG